MEEIADQKAYSKKVMLSEGIVVLEATATWCSKCKAIKPFVDKLITKYPDAKFYNYDTDTNPDVAHELGVNGMPTFHIFKDGDVTGSVVGARGVVLENAIKEVYDGKVEDVNMN